MPAEQPSPVQAVASSDVRGPRYCDIFVVDGRSQHYQRVDPDHIYL